MSGGHLTRSTVSLPCTVKQSLIDLSMISNRLSMASRWGLVRTGYTGSLLRLRSNFCEREGSEAISSCRLSHVDCLTLREGENQHIYGVADTVAYMYIHQYYFCELLYYLQHCCSGANIDISSCCGFPKLY